MIVDHDARTRFQAEANQAILPVQNLLNLLMGGSWLEVLAAESVSRQADIQDARWSVPELNPTGQQATEHDVLALWHGRLVRVSCKLGLAGDKLPAAASEAAHQARRLGGILGIGVLCVGHVTDSRRRKALADRMAREHPFRPSPQ